MVAKAGQEAGDRAENRLEALFPRIPGPWEIHCQEVVAIAFQQRVSVHDYIMIIYFEQMCLLQGNNT